MAQRVVVVGTGTDVGKTFVTAALAACARADGRRVVAWKPIASGVEGDFGEDALALADAAGHAPIRPAYVFAPPVSPHLAAREAGVTIDLARLRAGADALPDADLALVETAGGLFSPVAPGLANADLVRALAPSRVLLVAPDRIGVLHDLTATWLAARAAGVAIDAVVLSAPAAPDASTGTNAAEAGVACGIDVVATVPRGARDDAAVQSAARCALALLTASR